MPIAPLEASTVRALGSAQVLTDSTSLVKELLDNALDASATNISVEISSNALDKIQVTDNGSGIFPADRELVCKRHCTSKISNFHDLRTIGGSSLGFRGEALASAAELSQSVVVTTRTKNEPVGVALSFDREGSLSNQQQTSHPIGTTIAVTDFLATLPIRKQVALKAAPKAPASIKALIQTYAIARPTIRFSLKVSKTKDTKANWTYSPRPDATALNAILQIAGTQISQQCNVHTWSTETEPLFHFQAVLPKVSDDAATSHGKQYIIVDGRPLSVTRSGAKSLAKIVKTYIRSAKRDESDSRAHSEPFFSLSIECPPGSYDANVEPAKDDVLFEDIESLKEHLERFLGNIYGPLSKGSEASDDTIDVLTPKEIATRPAFDILMNSSYRVTPVTQPKPKNSQARRDFSREPVVNMLAGDPIQIRPRRIEDQADAPFSRAQEAFHLRERSTDDGGIFLEPESPRNAQGSSNEDLMHSSANNSCYHTPLRSVTKPKRARGQTGPSQRSLHGYLPTPQTEDRPLRGVPRVEQTYDIDQLRGDFRSARAVLEGLPLDKMPEMACRRPKANRQTQDQTSEDEISAESDIEVSDGTVATSRSKLSKPHAQTSLSFTPINGLSMSESANEAQRSNRSPHRNRYLAAKAALTAPAHYRIDNKQAVRQSAREEVPLDVIPHGQETLDLICAMDLNLSQVKESAVQQQSFSQPDDSFEDFLQNGSLCELWKNTLTAMYQERTTDEELLAELQPINIAHSIFLE